MTEHQTIVSDISSISTKIEAIEQKLAGPQILPAEVLQQVTEAACEAARKSHTQNGPSEANQIILRSYIHESDVLKLPDDARENDIILPLHGYKDLPPHRHSRDDEIRLKSLSPDDMIAMVQKSPCYVQYTNNICPTCQEDKFGEFSSTCKICRGWYHNACQTLQSYHKDGHRPLLLCNFCREQRIREISVVLMWDCSICCRWVEQKKGEVANLVTSRVRQARLNNLLLQKEDTIQEYIFGRISKTEDTISQSSKQMILTQTNLT